MRLRARETDKVNRWWRLEAGDKRSYKFLLQLHCTETSNMAENNTDEKTADGETATFLQLVHQTHRNAKLQGNSKQMPPRIQSSSLPASSSSTVAKWHLTKKRFHHLLLFTKNQLTNVLWWIHKRCFFCRFCFCQISELEKLALDFHTTWLVCGHFLKVEESESNYWSVINLLPVTSSIDNKTIIWIFCIILLLLNAYFAWQS